MITTIVLTAITTAALMMAAMYRRNAYVSNVEQTSLQLTEENEVLRSSCNMLTDELLLQQDLATGLLSSNQVYRNRIKLLEAHNVETNDPL